MLGEDYLRYFDRLLKFEQNPVSRTYQGGRLLSEFLGREGVTDGEFPEEWIASTTTTHSKIELEGISKVIAKDVSIKSFREMIELYPYQMLGKKYIDTYGTYLIMLTKLLDAAERLTIQVHPTDEMALRFFNTPYGKTEAWYILACREGTDNKACVYIGFKPGITKERWAMLFEAQDIQGMLDSLHQFDAEEDQVYLVEGGMPHAIGEGCFILELQQSTDYTFRVERKTPRGYSIEEQLCHQGIGFKHMLECFNYQGLSRQDTYDKVLIQHKPHIKKNSFERQIDLPVSEKISDYYEKGFRCIPLIDASRTPYFGMSRWEIFTMCEYKNQSSFMILIVIKGSGVIHVDQEKHVVTKGDYYFLTAIASELTITNDIKKEDNPLIIICCFPPV